MSDRRRGEDTKERVLEEACKVFAEKGYRDATHAEICGRAGANAAAVNYYFASKENLYRAVFQRLSQEAERLFPLDGGLPTTAPAERRLHGFIRAHLSRILDPELLGDLHRIRMSEVFDPTGLLNDLMGAQLAQHRKQVQGTLRELLGPQASQRDVEWCEMSVVSQCLVGAPGPVHRGAADGGPRAIFGLGVAEVDRLADHILRFSLAGIKAIARRAQAESNAPKGSPGNSKKRSGR